MSPLRCIIVTVIITLFALPAVAEGLQAGTGKVDISPPPGIPLAGYGARNIPVKKYNQGVHDHIYARALILDDGQTRVGLVLADALLILDEIRLEMIEKVQDLDLDLLILSATHTHSGMGGYVDVKIMEIAVLGPYDPQARDIFMNGIEKALRQAAADMQPAKLGSTIADAPLVTSNRRHKGAVTDPDMGVIRIDDLAGEPLAFILNFAIHPTLMPPSNLLISGDVTGRTETTIEERYPNAVAMFYNSGMGDQQPDVDWAEASWEQVNRIGDTMAEHALQISSDIQTTDQVSLTTYSHTFEMPEVYLRPALSCWFGLNPLVKKMGQPLMRDTGEIAGLAINDDTMLLANPAEITYDIERHLSDTWPDKKVFILTHSNDYYGYIVTPEDYETGGYETCMNFYGKDFGPLLEKQFRKMVNGN